MASLDDIVEQHGIEPRMQAFAEAARDLAIADDRFRHSLLYAKDVRSDMGRPTRGVYLFNLCVRTANHLLRDRPDYAVFTQTADGWKEALTSLLDDPDSHYYFDAYLSTHEVQTNVPARYMGPKLILGLYRDRFPYPINLLDIGPSYGAGVKGFLANRIHHDVDVLVPSKGEVDNSVALSGSPALTEYVNGLLVEPFKFAQCAGIDKVAAFSESEKQWVRSCFYPSELAEPDTGVVAEFDQLAELALPNYRSYVGDFSEKDHVAEFLDDSPVRQFDVITILTMLHQLTERERVRVLRHARQLLSPSGLIIVQDFARVNPNRKSKLEFFPHWHPYTYRTMVIDPSSGKNTADEMLWWSSARPSQVIIAPTANQATVKEDLREGLGEIQPGL